MIESRLRDTSLISGDHSLAPIEDSYIAYDYEQVPSDVNSSSITTNTRLTFNPTSYSDSVYDLSNSYIEFDITPIVILKDPNTGSSVKYLPSFATTTIDDFMTSALVQSVRTTLAGTDVSSVNNINTNSAPGNAMYTLINNRRKRVNGRAVKPLVVNQTTTAIEGLGGYTLAMTEGAEARPDICDVLEDTDDPFEMCLESNYNLPMFIDSNKVLNTIFDSSGPTILSTPYSQSYVYRNNLITSKSNVNGPPDTITISKNHLKFRYKPKCSFWEIGKIPANMSMQVVAKITDDFWKVIRGNKLADACLCNLPSDPEPANANGVVYSIEFNSVNLYMKRLILAQEQLTAYAESRFLRWDTPRYSVQSYNITSANLNQRVSFDRFPKLLLIGIFKNTTLSPISNTNDINFRSLVGSTWCGNSRQYGVGGDPNGISDLSLEVHNLETISWLGRVPKEPYSTVNETGQVDLSGCARAYKAFQNALINKETVGFNQWQRFYRYYAFEFTPEGDNILGQSIPVNRSELSIKATLVPADNGIAFTDYTLVVMGVSDAVTNITDFRTVLVNI